MKTFVTSNGDEMNILLNANGSPAYWPNLYATQKLRNTRRSPRTIYNILRPIGMATDWMASQARDFSERMIHEDPLLFEETSILADFLALSIRAQKDWLKVEPARTGSSPRPNVSNSLEKVRTSHKVMTESPREHLSAAAAAANIRGVAGYLDWIYTLRKHPNRLANFDPERQILAKEGLDHFRKQTPRVKASGDDDESLWAMEFHHCLIIESIVLPGSEENPWADAFVKDRNYLIWRLFLETGARRGEIHNIKVSDFDLSKYRVTLRVSKTIPRTVPYKPKTSALVHEYIERHWRHLPKTARRAGYLFTSRDGDRLSLRSINLLFQTLRSVAPDIPNWVTPHTMRRTWNERFSEMIDAQTGDDKSTEEQERKIRNRLMGWTPQSKMAEKYLRRHTRRKADEISEKMFQDVEIVGDKIGDTNGA
ncbi:tyrosine-type recombinase/integrase [Microvirga brassicacearum]|uniref:tyrosine-type recombinase/integrase n=1 Tax=Microvirga brassicacearum TaxID=2580413 RepID=UPI00139171E4|nr:site-specific integrase [Microvirga brassicacearum]